MNFSASVQSANDQVPAADLLSGQPAGHAARESTIGQGRSSGRNDSAEIIPQVPCFPANPGLAKRSGKMSNVSNPFSGHGGHYPTTTRNGPTLAVFLTVVTGEGPRVPAHGKNTRVPEHSDWKRKRETEKGDGKGGECPILLVKRAEAMMDSRLLKPLLLLAHRCCPPAFRTGQDPCWCRLGGESTTIKGPDKAPGVPCIFCRADSQPQPQLRLRLRLSRNRVEPLFYLLQKRR